MQWSQVQQVLRIIIFSAAGWLFGQGVTEGELFQQAVGGLLSVGAFAWWLVWEHKTEHVTPR